MSDRDSSIFILYFGKTGNTQSDISRLIWSCTRPSKTLFNRYGIAGAVLQKALSLIIN